MQKSMVYSRRRSMGERSRRIKKYKSPDILRVWVRGAIITLKWAVRERFAPGLSPRAVILEQQKGLVAVGFLTPYRQYFLITLIIVAIALIVSILLQVRGAGLGSVFGGTGTVFKTRRGIDLLLSRITIAFSVLFVLLCLLTTAIPAS
jgi:preprotein translocase subunit SecG